MSQAITRSLNHRFIDKQLILACWLYSPIRTSTSGCTSHHQNPFVKLNSTARYPISLGFGAIVSVKMFYREPVTNSWILVNLAHEVAPCPVMLHTYAYVYRSSFLLSVQAKVSGRLILVQTGLNERIIFWYWGRGANIKWDIISKYFGFRKLNTLRF